MRLWTVTCMVLAACLAELFSPRCEAQVTLIWKLSPSAGVASYNVAWGTNSGNYLYTNNYPNTGNTATISNLATNQAFFFVVQAVASNGLASEFSNEQGFTNGEPAIVAGPPLGGGPPPPTGGGPTNIASTNGNPPTGGPPTGTPPVAGGGSTNVTQSTFWGVPPFLGLTASNGQVNLTVNGTVGALLNIMDTTNELALNEWSALTNVTLTNIASVAETNQQSQVQDVLDVAFVPGTQTLSLNNSNASSFHYFQVAMPYDYIILASQVLRAATNYTPRLVVVNMPGIVCDDVCYVNEANSFIHYSHTNYALQLFSSGSTIRQIANTLAGSLNLDWTSASEFTYSNGMGQILATVIETEPSTSDPVAGQHPPSTPIVINF